MKARIPVRPGYTLIEVLVVLGPESAEHPIRAVDNESGPGWGQPIAFGLGGVLLASAAILWWRRR
jgi:hypothetical protein